MNKSHINATKETENICILNFVLISDNNETKLGKDLRKIRQNMPNSFNRSLCGTTIRQKVKNHHKLGKIEHIRSE